MAVIAHHRLCARHASEWVPDENDCVCIFVESLVCDGELVEYVPASQLAGAVERFREWSRDPEAVRILAGVVEGSSAAEDEMIAALRTAIGGQ
jgi:hypothetical protein